MDEIIIEPKKLRKPRNSKKQNKDKLNHKPKKKKVIIQIQEDNKGNALTLEEIYNNFDEDTTENERN